MKKNRTYHNLFDDWNEQSAYVLGFWMADGYITFARRPNKIYKQFGFSNTDEQTISYLCKVFDCNRHKNGKAFLVRVYSDKLFDFCYDLVGSTRKSVAETKLPPLPDDMFKHFVRGFFDGDGSIYWVRMKTRHGKSIKNLKISFTAGLDTGEFLSNMVRKIQEHIPIKKNSIYIGKTNKKIIFGQYDSALLCQWMYANATVFMARKKQIWNSADHAKLLESAKFHMPA